MNRTLSGQHAAFLEAAQRIAERVPRALFVGGIVRDALLHQQAHDADLEVFGVPADRLETLLGELFPDQVNVVGRSFGVFIVTLDHGLRLDVALPRRESKTGPGHKGFSVEGDPLLSLEEAAQRRDFTIGALYADPMSDTFLDPCGGMKDLEQGLLRVVDPRTFRDDPLRIFRAAQLTARFGLKVEPATLDLMRTMVARGDTDELSKERITEEIRKLLLLASKPSLGFALLHDLGVIARSYPELHALIETPQEPAWHPEGDVWIHTLMVLDQAALLRDRFSEPSERLQLMLGALCHDLGKPSTTKMGEKGGVPRIRSLGHEEAGEAPTRSLLARWTFGEDAERAAVAVAMQHLKPGMLLRQLTQGALTEETYANAVRKLIKRIFPVSWRVLLAAAEADHRGRGLPDAKTEPYEAGERFVATVSLHALGTAPLAPLIHGQDLIERGMTPGPQMGECIKRIEEARDRGEIRTREEALAYLDHL